MRPDPQVLGVPSRAARVVAAPIRVPLPRVARGRSGQKTDSIYEAQSVMPDVDAKVARLAEVTAAGGIARL